MPEYEAIEVEREGRVGIVRWNRPAQLNAMNQTMYREWIAAYDAFNEDPSIGAVVVTGNGRAYSSGADIGGFERTFTGGNGQQPPPPEPAAHPPFAPWYRTAKAASSSSVFEFSMGFLREAVVTHACWTVESRRAIDARRRCAVRPSRVR